MKKVILLSLLSILTFGNIKAQKIDWDGSYSYSINSYGKLWIHDLQIIKKGSQWVAKYNVDGSQTMIRQICSAKLLSPQKMEISFVKYGKNDMFKRGTKPGDKVLMLEHKNGKWWIWQYQKSLKGAWELSDKQAAQKKK